MPKAKRAVPTRNKKIPKKTGNTDTRKSGKIYIANHHCAVIVLPRTQAQGSNIVQPPLNLMPGELTPVDISEWIEKRKNKIIKYYLDKGVIEEIKKNSDKEVHVSVGRTSNPPVPEHLKSDDEEFVGRNNIGKAKVIKSVVG